MTTETQTKTLKLRLKNKLRQVIFCKVIRSRRPQAGEYAGFLREHARAVNFVWNFCNELSFKHFDRKREFMSAYDMQPYTKGASAELGLHSQTVQAVQEEYCTRRKQLNWPTEKFTRFQGTV